MNKIAKQQIEILANDAKNGCADSERQLFEASWQIVRKRSRPHEDLAQDAALSFPKWLCTWNPESSAWLSWLYMKFEYFRRDFWRKPVNHPTAKFTRRSGASISSMSIDKMIDASRTRGPFGNWARSLMPGIEDKTNFEFVDFINGLPLAKGRREIFLLYYVKGLTMRQIGEQLGKSESRVSQMHTQSINELRQLAKVNGFGFEGKKE